MLPNHKHSAPRMSISDLHTYFTPKSQTKVDIHRAKETFKWALNRSPIFHRPYSKGGVGVGFQLLSV